MKVTQGTFYSSFRRDGRVLIAAVLVILALSTPVASQAVNCGEYFLSEDSTVSGVSSTIVRKTVSEKTSVGSFLYTLTWTSDVTKGPMPAESDISYFSIDESVENSWTISLANSLEHLPDFPDSTVKLYGSSYFDPCNLQLVFEIQDENTETPTFETGDSYSVSIREDYPVDMPVMGLTISVRDYDYESPNNVFEVTTDADCPLEATQPEYDGANGQIVNVEMKLRSQLDYEIQPAHTCTVTAKDKGATPLFSEATVDITLEDMQDEPPIFTELYYYGNAFALMVGDEVDILNGPISAKDGDESLNSPITYTLEDAVPEILGTDYFEIESNTGVVKLKADLDEEILAQERLAFLIKAEEENLDYSTAFLDVNLPPMPTTTVTPEPTTTPTEVTCPECTCPTTESTTTISTTEGTCSPCPTFTTGEPCTTISTVEETDEPTECPTTTCPECPTTSVTPASCPVCPTTEATTPCPTVTCPPDVTTTKPTEPTIKFPQDTYALEIYPNFDRIFTLSVEVSEGFPVGDVKYSFVSGNENDDFAIDEVTGDITSNKDALETGRYELSAKASAGELHDETLVSIVVLEPLNSNNLTLVKSLVTYPVMENGNSEEELGKIEVLGGDPGTICITNVDPASAKGKFDTIRKDGGDWYLKRTGVLDFEDTPEVMFKLKAFLNERADCSDSGSSSEFLRNEALIIVEVTDMNDEDPEFIVPERPGVVVAYPKDVSLQKVVGPVITLKAYDRDTPALKYGLGPDVTGFAIEEDTGNVYVESEFDCSDACEVSVTTSDNEKVIQSSIKILSLDMAHIHTLKLPNIEVSAVDDRLHSLSVAAGVTISRLYVNPSVTLLPSQKVFALRDKSNRANEWELQVNVYGVDENDNLMDLASVNSKLTEASTGFEAEAFIDRNVFEPSGTTDDVVGYQVAVGILAALLGLILIAIGFLVYKKKIQNKGGRSPQSISTVGGAYPNLAYNDQEEDERDGSLGRKVNGSTKGFDNAFMRDERRDSPPLHVSALSNVVSESPKSYSKSGEQRGLRRTEPGATNYYGSSSPLPPPSFSTDTKPQSASAFTSESKAPSSSIYPSIASTSGSSSSSYVRSTPKKELPPRNAAPAKSILRGTVGSVSESSQDVPLAVLGSSKLNEPATDYEEAPIITTSKFASLKQSPTLKKSSAPVVPDEDESDAESGRNQRFGSLDGKKSNIKQEDLDGNDEEKKVAFKVLVDTKEIEAENEGPAQKKAAAQSDAMDILEANKRKLEMEGGEESDEDEDEDEDEGIARL